MSDAFVGLLFIRFHNVSLNFASSQTYKGISLKLCESKVNDVKQSTATTVEEWPT
jgi:hypothetical protein